MDNFIELAMRTASGQFYGDQISENVFLGYLEQMVHLGEDLDHIKKTLFYGKEPHEFSKRWDEMDMPTQTDLVPADVIHGILGVITEAAELADALLRAMRNEAPLDMHNIHEESGDIKWYLAMLARAHGVEWDADEKMVIAKLQKRYPEKFSLEAATNRNLEAEREIIEGKST